ncbi:HK97 family phage prohead protease [Streptomyces sp. NPDC059477]|uniref:HK97 family phage prohead protease n=1 Tax=Streptomyces sp. NPDC059477 TaxID=3346847 RepID=UPI0036B7ED41
MPAMQAVARELLRSVPFRIVRDDAASEEGDGWTLTGYAVTFGQETEIDSWEGRFFESVRRGAFRKTFREQTPVCQFDHGRHPLIGSIPIGAFRELYEDDQGVFVSNRITDNWLMQPIRDAIASGSITGMSFRFEVVREQWTDAQGKTVRPEEVAELLWAPGDRGPLHRELIEVKCRELGPVVFPAYTGTSVSVRARDQAAVLARDDEFTRSIRASLARSAAATPPVPDDQELRREVAAALLYPTALDTTPVVPEPPAPPSPGHPGQTRTTSAPPALGHPLTPSTPDAPPAAGHPSPDPDTTRRRAQIAEIRGLMRGVLESIPDKDD